MPLEAGRRLGAYEIVAPLGAGGMGEVYRARDTRLDRVVAVKVLPEQLATNPELRQRLEREARTISGVSHPHICALYDVGHEDGVDFLVMEYLEGDTLSDRLAKGALPTSQVLRYGVEIADALAAAHRHGVVHRDLKPGNVVVTKAGAKLLDFGLAKLKRDAVEEGSALSALATADEPLTGEGRVVGTVQYMAPEQIEGKEADPRTDVFALGAVLYEMATGKRPFQAKSRAGLIAAILEHEPAPISTVQPMLPAALDRVVRTCLAKEPDERWQSAHDVAAELKWIGESLSQPAVMGSRAARLSRRSVAWALGGALVGALATAVVLRQTRPAQAAPRFPTRAVIALPDGVVMPDIPSAITSFALSPDGRTFAFAAYASAFENRRIYVRATGDVAARELPGTDGAFNPFFSPDGRWIGFASKRKLMKLSLAGGEPLVVCDAPALRGASWGPDGTILFTPDIHSGLFRVSADGGEPQEVTTLDAAKGETSHRWPFYLAGARAVLFTVIGARSREEDRAIALVSLETGNVKRLAVGGTYPRFLEAPSTLLFARTGSLMAAPFDLERLEPLAAPTPVLEDLRMDVRDNGRAEFDVSSNGSLVYVPGFPRPPERTLVWVDRRGRATPVTETRRAYVAPSISPDGRRVAAQIEGTTDDIWIGDLERDTWTRLTDEGTNHDPSWSADGRRVAFSSDREGRTNPFWIPSDGSGAAERLARIDGSVYPSAFSPDGSVYACAAQMEKTGHDVVIVALKGERTARSFLATTSFENFPTFSPDARFIAYSSLESGRPEVYVRPFPGGGQKWLISRDGGDEPTWSRTGNEIFYRWANKVMAVPVRTRPDFAAAAPQVLFEGVFAMPGDGRTYDAAPDGQRFMMIKDPDRQAAPPLVAVPYFLEEMQERLGRR
ncbi:MAG TPA: protein kinase [Vicinamibacteria bacterium]|nr:protein kinase [Vicinamibacteria bacterium]